MTHDRSGPRSGARPEGKKTSTYKLLCGTETRLPLIIWGTGGHAKVVFETARSMGYERIQFVDEAPSSEANFLGCPVSSPDTANLVETNVDFVVAIGANESRARCFALGLRKGWRPAKLIHPSATISEQCQIGGACVVLARAVVNWGARIGCNCIINTGSVVEHDCSLADHVHLGPGAILGGNVSVGTLSLIGLNASLLPGLSVGSKAIVGGGAVVARSVPDDVTVAGSPARVVHPAIVATPGPTARILLSVPHMSGLEQRYVNDAFVSNWLSTVGPNISAFEEEFGSKFKTAALALSSGTAAIHLGLRALGVGPGDTVFCSDLTFVASANPILYQGATPVFIDSDEATWNMDPILLEEALNEANRAHRLPKAVVVVDLFGQCADMDPLLDCCGRYGVPVLEDAAEAIGATYKGRWAGTMGDVGAFSFNGNKMMTTTGGGMLVSKNLDLVSRARFLATQAREPGLAYEHVEAGYNYRLSNVLAGIGRGQLRVLDERVRQRREIAFRYARGLAKVPGVSLMPQAAYGESANWLSCFRINETRAGCSRDELISLLNSDHIETRPVWKPMHTQPLYKSAKHYGGGISELLFREGICLPSSSSLSAADQQYVIHRMKERLAMKAADAPKRLSAAFPPGA